MNVWDKVVCTYSIHCIYNYKVMYCFLLHWINLTSVFSPSEVHSVIRERWPSCHGQALHHLPFLWSPGGGTEPRLHRGACPETRVWLDGPNSSQPIKSTKFIQHTGGDDGGHDGGDNGGDDWGQRGRIARRQHKVSACWETRQISAKKLLLIYWICILHIINSDHIDVVCCLSEDSSCSSSPSEGRVLCGVIRIGLVAKGLLIKDDMDLELVLMCREKPTKTLLSTVCDNLLLQIEVTAHTQTTWATKIHTDHTTSCTAGVLICCG